MARRHFKRYSGRLSPVVDASGKQMRSREGALIFETQDTFSYIDSRGKRVTVPKGFITDLMSSPRGAHFVKWLRPGNPKARPAVIVHDAGCVFRNESYKVVHWRLYDALRCCGFSKWRAGLIWVGVMLRGPKW